MKVDWQHDLADETVVLYSEVIDGWETRKVEVYRDGRIDHASEDVETGTAKLSEVLMPTVEDIAEQTEFVPVEISVDDFESVWRQATGARLTQT